MRLKAAPAVAQPYPRYAACDSITNFGAIGDGTADDAVALQKAINSVASGCSIFFPPGVYRLATDITIGKDITFQLGPQVEVRQYGKLIPDSNAIRSLTILGEGPGTSLWRQAVDYPFYPGSGRPLFKSFRFINLEFRPYTALGNPHQYGGSTDILEMNSVTLSRGNSDSGRVFGLGTPGISRATAALVVLRDVVVSGINMSLILQNADLEITRMTADITSSLVQPISVERGGVGGSGRVLISGCRLNIGFISSSAVSPVIELISSSSARLVATINDVEIVTASWNGAISAQTYNTSELNLLVNSLRFTVTYNIGTGYAINLNDVHTTSTHRAVLSGCFFRTVTGHSDAAIQGVQNASSLRTIAGVDQRGWASLT
jgi:hypothetical protein